MSILRTLLVLTLLAVPAIAAASGIQRLSAPARITAVTVYPDRAMTTRSASLNLKPGSYLVAFEGLPDLLQDDSVLVAGRGSAGVAIVGTEVKRAFAEQVPEKLAKELDDRIQALEVKLSGLDGKKTALEARKSFIESIKVAWGERISKELAVGRPTAAELNEAANFVGTGVEKVEEQLLELRSEQKQLRDRIDALRRQREQAVGSNRKESKTVEVSLDVTRAGTLVLEMNGLVPRAGWEPSYDVRLAPDGKSAELTFRAMVRQQTGEDWQGVDLSLSTARPSVGGTPPELSPWRIAFYRPPQPVMAAPSARFGVMKAARQASVLPEMAEPEVADEAAGYVTAGMEEGQTAVSFHITRPVDIPADGTGHGSVVAVEQLPLTLECLAIPKLSSNVYLRSELVNNAAYPLLPGKVNIFSGNDYSGSSRLKRIASGATFELSFGVDDRVTVKREELKSHKEAGLFGANRMSYHYRIEVQNFHKEPRTVIVRDQLPVPGDAEIKASLEEPSSKPAEMKDDGTMTWKFPVAAGGKQDLTFGVQVEYPKGREVTGL